jgi:hypothetical protein
MIGQAIKLARLGLAEQVAPASRALEPLRDLSQGYLSRPFEAGGVYVPCSIRTSAI